MIVAKVLVYHKVDDSYEWGITQQKVNQFKRQMDFLYNQGYKTVSLDEALKSRQNNSFDQKVALNFDDGYQSVYTYVFPILQKFGFTATVFLITDFIGKENSWDFNLGGKRFKHLSWDQIRQMKEYGFSFQSHTVTHPDLTRIGKKNITYELEKSKKYLEDKLGEQVNFLSYPFGKHNHQIREKARKIGYQGALTLSYSSGQNHPFALGRIGIYLWDSPLTLKMKLSSGFWFKLENLKGKVINRFSSLSFLVENRIFKR